MHRDALVRHAVEPIDSLPRGVEDVFGFTRYVVRSVRKLGQKDRRGLHHIMKNRPPWGVLVETDRVGLGCQKVNHAQRGMHTSGRGGEVEFLGGARLVWYFGVYSAETRPVDDDSRALMTKSQGETLPSKPRHHFWTGEIKHWRKAHSPVVNQLIECLYRRFGFGPGSFHGMRAVKGVHHFVRERTDSDVVIEEQGVARSSVSRQVGHGADWRRRRHHGRRRRRRVNGGGLLAGDPANRRDSIDVLRSTGKSVFVKRGR